MIATVRGQLLGSGLDWVVLDINGVGFRVSVPPSLLGKLPAVHAEMELSTYLVVRDDALTLYGFETAADRDTFEILLGVTGIGPRTALASLSVFTAAELRDAIDAADLTALQRIPGVGKKSAQRMLLELSGKLTGLQGEAGAAGSSQVRDEVGAALEQLGWTKAAATKALDQVGAEHEDAPGMLRAALLVLGAHRA